MPFNEPGWWYRAEPTIAARLLAPFACLYGWEARRRYHALTPFAAEIPVICVGNFTAGGTGKTPLALHLADKLRQCGIAPAFLSRGYKARRTGPHWVDIESDTAADVGDEPLLLAHSAPALISPDRAAGARAMVAAANGIQAIIMDDGLQNAGLAKTLSIAVVDGARGLGNRRVIPAGPLRAPIDFQLPLADAIVVNTPASHAGQPAAITPWLAQRFDRPILHATTEPAGDTQWLRDAPLVAFCGIGAPARFFDLLESLGARLAARTAFPDHHPLSEAEAQALIAEAGRRQATLVTTEKDWVRLSGATALGELKSLTRTLPIRLVFDAADTAVLDTLLDRSLARAATAPGSP